MVVKKNESEKLFSRAFNTKLFALLVCFNVSYKRTFQKIGRCKSAPKKVALFKMFDVDGVFCTNLEG